MKRYLAGFAGLFFFLNVVGCAAAEDAGEQTSDISQNAAEKLADRVITTGVSFADRVDTNGASPEGPTCLAGKYSSSSSWETIELFANGEGLRAERLHDGTDAKMAQGRFFWSATDRTITIGVHEQPMRVETDCRFVWIGDAMFTRAAH